MNPMLWWKVRRRQRAKQGREAKSFKQLVNELSQINNEYELEQYARENDLSSEELAGLWDTIKKATSSVGKAVGGVAQRIWQPVSQAITQRTQYEVDTAGQRLAQQIMPASLQPTPMPVIPEQRDTTLDTIIKYAPFVIGGILVFKLMQRGEK